MKLLQSHPDSLMDFNRWVDIKKQEYSQQIVTAASSMEEVLGLRYMFGELDALRSEINFDMIEQQQLAALEGEDDGGRELDIWC